MGSVISAILAICKAAPIFDRWVQQLLVAYSNARVDSMAKENRDAIKKAITDQDQREIEKLLGSSRAGELSGVPGTEVRDSLPGVKP